MQDGRANKVVLVVDDESVIRMSLADVLTDVGYVVLEAGSADEAIGMLLGDGPVDAVVTDVRMPGPLDGIGLASWLHRHRATIPVVVTSGYVTDAKAKAAHPNARLLPKPYASEDVIALLGDLIA